MNAEIIPIDEMLLDLEGYHQKIQEKTKLADWKGIQKLVAERHNKIMHFIEFNKGKNLDEAALIAIQKKLKSDDKKLQHTLVEHKNSLIKSRINLNHSYKSVNEYRTTRNQS